MTFRCPVRIGLALVFGTIAIFVIAIIRGTKSEDAEAYQMLKGLLPAGNCLCRTSTTFECAACLDCAGSIAQKPEELQAQSNWTFIFGRDDKNEGLNEAQCAASFPGLFEDIRRAVDLRKDNPVTLEELDAINIHNGNSLGIVRAKIHDGEVCCNRIHHATPSRMTSAWERSNLELKFRLSFTFSPPNSIMSAMMITIAGKASQFSKV